MNALRKYDYLIFSVSDPPAPLKGGSLKFRELKVLFRGIRGQENFSEWY
jgi:hypothetical protein